MSARFVKIDRETPMLLPVDMRDWLPANHLVYFVVDAIEHMDISGFKVNRRGSGSEQYPPKMMLALLIYSYLTKRFGSRTIEEATYTDLAMRYICGGNAHPDHSVISRFRQKNKEVFEDTFTKILLLARELKKLKKVGGASVDGSKIDANASKHKAVSYKRAGEIVAKIQKEVAELVKMGEEADGKGLAEGLSISEEIKRREDRKAVLLAAKASMEKMYEEAKAEGSKKGKKLDDYQYNFTDSESRIMKAGNGQHFEQSYNALSAVDTEGSMMILGGYVTQNTNDKKELEKIVSSVSKEVRELDSVSGDCGFYSDEEVAAVERMNAEGKKEGPEVYCAVEKGKHGRTVDELRKKDPLGEPPEGLSAKEKMSWKLKTEKGKEIYKKRKETVETVFGIIKSVMGFRQFMLRGIEKVNTEWSLVMTSYNFKRLHKLLGGIALSECLANV